MKTNLFYKYLLAIVFVLTIGTGCKKYDDLQTNPNLPTNATPALLLTNICYSVFYFDNTPQMFSSRELTYYERGNSFQDYSWTTGSFSNYDVLRQVKQMDSLAVQNGQSQYLGLTKLFRAILFSQMTEIFGDIPYTQALQAVGGNFKPVYDPQETIYKGILQELDDANSLLDDSKGLLVGDIIYGGSASKWKKLANVYKLRLLIHLSKKQANTNLNITTQFQNIISNPTKYPLFSSNADNAQLTFNASATNNYYPTYGNLSLSTSISMEKSFVKILKDRSDPRLFAFADPVGTQPAGVFSSYEGVDGSQTLSTQQTASASASRIKARYYNDNINEPWIFIGYQEQEFLIAEAIARGWITGAGTAQSHYEAGITASMAFYGITGATATAYLTQPLVAYNPADPITQIIIQKYISLFMKSGYEVFWEQRRTGIPTLAVGPGTSNNMLVPKRFLYPTSEQDNNADNLKAALQRQYGGTDDKNAAMWLIQ